MCGGGEGGERGRGEWSCWGSSITQFIVFISCRKRRHVGGRMGAVWVCAGCGWMAVRAVRVVGVVGAVRAGGTGGRAGAAKKHWAGGASGRAGAASMEAGAGSC